MAGTRPAVNDLAVRPNTDTPSFSGQVAPKSTGRRRHFAKPHRRFTSRCQFIDSSEGLSRALKSGKRSALHLLSTGMQRPTTVANGQPRNEAQPCCARRAMQHTMPSKSPNPKWSVEHYLRPYLLILQDERKPFRALKEDYTTRKLAQVQRWIKQGRGSGRNDSYSPWLRITRRFSSPVSHMVFAALSVHQRNHHFLSKLEHHTGLLLAYLGASEIRECLPLWPTEHSNPIQDDRVERCRGLRDIAEQHGIEHGFFVGTDVPYIASIDIMAKVPWHGKTHYVGVSCKPDPIMASSQRARERVNLDRLYCKEIGARHIHESGASFNQTLAKNIETYRPSLFDLQELVGSTKLRDFCGHFNQAPDGWPLHQIITESGNSVQAKGPDAAQLWRVGMWTHEIDIDLRERVAMLKPVRRGGMAVRAALAHHFLGEAACH